MDFGSIFLILAITVLVSIFISRPFFENRKNERLNPDRDWMQKEHKRSALLAERDRVLNTIQELETDFEMGKIPEEDYEPQREALLLAGAETLKQLDAIKLEASRSKRTQPNVQEDELEKLITARRTKKELRQQFCPHCGAESRPGDQFCTSCGKKLAS